MRLFQVGHIYPTQRDLLRPHVESVESYEAAMRITLRAIPKSHILKPCLEQESSAFLSLHQDPTTMGLWARQNGLKPETSLDDILLAQVEDHAPEIFYNIHSTKMSAGLIRRLPGCVKVKIAWLGSPMVSDGYQDFDVVVSNFPSINARHQALGLRTDYFIPSYDPTVETLSTPESRDIDLLFVGGYSRHHKNRAQFLNRLACELGGFRFALHLDNSRYTRLAETPLGWFPPLSAVRRPKAVRQLAQPAIFGPDLFSALLRAKIVVNMAIDMAGEDRGNIRCFEALSAGALLLSDAGVYPEGFRDGENMVLYRTPDEAIGLIRELLADEKRRESIARAGETMVRSFYSKEKQWMMFEQLCARTRTRTTMTRDTRLTVKSN